MSVTRNTISFNDQNWQLIHKAKNRSKLVNIALQYYFNAQKFLRDKESEFILGELNHYTQTGESYSFDETFND